MASITIRNLDDGVKRKLRLRAAQPRNLAAAIVRARGAAVATRNGADFAGCGIIVLDPWTA